MTPSAQERAASLCRDLECLALSHSERCALVKTALETAYEDGRQDEKHDAERCPECNGYGNRFYALRGTDTCLMCRGSGKKRI